MSSPLKPWEGATTLQQRFEPANDKNGVVGPPHLYPGIPLSLDEESRQLHLSKHARSSDMMLKLQKEYRDQSIQSSSPNIDFTNGVPPPVRPLSHPVRNVPPPLPARPMMNRQGFSQSYPYNRMGMYNGNYGLTRSYGGYGYNGYSSYGGYGGGFGNYNGYGINNSLQNYPESRLIQLAEESSRPAFESIESLVRAFGSISFMLETTYDTIYNSFRAVLDVAENVGRMRSVFGQIFSTFGIIRAMQWIYKRALYLLGYSSQLNEKLWNEASSSNMNFPESKDISKINKKSSWGVLILLSILLTGPYIIWKLLNSLNLAVNNPYNLKLWMKSQNPCYGAVGLYDFEASNEQELSFKAKQMLIVAPREYQTWGKNWFLACRNKKYGLVPHNYITFTKIMKAKTNNANPTSSHDPNNPMEAEFNAFQENEFHQSPQIDLMTKNKTRNDSSINK